LKEPAPIIGPHPRARAFSSTEAPRFQFAIATSIERHVHQRESGHHEPVEDADRPVDDRHSLAADFRDQQIGKPDAVTKEQDAEHVDERRERPRHDSRHEAVDEIDLDVIVLAHVHRGADEGRGNQEVARDFLGPGGRVVEGIAREELVEDHHREHPEDAERDPVPRSGSG
jgi:hypothetical protein